jgi:hypothetical protein
VAQPKKSETRVYSLWTSPQSSWRLILDNVDVSTRREKTSKKSADRDLKKRREAFDTPIDHEALIRYVY